MNSVSTIATVPGKLFSKFKTSFYSDPMNAVFKALEGVIKEFGKIPSKDGKFDSYCRGIRIILI